MKKNRYIEAFCNPGAIRVLVWVMFQLWVVVRGSYSALVMRPIHVCLAMGLVFLTFPTFKKYKVSKGEKYLPQWYEYIFVGIILFCCVYMVMNSTRYGTRMTYIDPLTTMDYVIAIALPFLMFEYSRRAVNLVSTVIVLIFIGYGFFREMMPGLLMHSNMSLVKFVEVQIFSITGVFGPPVSTTCGTVFHFLLFGAFLTATSAGGLLVNISTLLTRKANGGAGKATIAASALFGMISGSAPGNVASIGTIIHEPMKQQNFENRFTGSILTIGGTTRQLIPPVMGVAAFIMVDMTGISYSNIMLAAIIPLFIFLAVPYFLVDMCARKNKLAKLQIEVAAYRKEIMRDIHLLLSVVALVALIIWGGSMMRCCTYITIVLVALCMIRKNTRTTLFDFIKALVATGKQAVIITMLCASAGIIVGQITVTGLGIRFSSMINALVSSNLLFALTATMLMVLVLGMDMPTSAVYTMPATLLCPNIIKLGVSVLAAHFFVFYLANPPVIIPPITLSSFTAAGIVNDNMWKLGLSAFKYSSIIFLIPYTFVYSPAMLGTGTSLKFLQSSLTCLAGAYGLSMGLIGCGIGLMKILERVSAIATSLCLVTPEIIADLIGVILMISLLSLQVMRSKKEKQVTV